MSNGLIIPSYATDYASNAARAMYPELWDGLVGAWMPFLGPTGLVLRDISGRHKHGALTNMDPPTDWVPTEVGMALDFDGGNDCVVVPDAPEWDVSELTISVWAYSRDDSLYLAVIGRTNAAGSANGMWALGNSNVVGEYRLRVRTTTGLMDVSGGTIHLNTWVHLCGTYKHGVGTLYQTGIEVASVAGGGVLPAIAQEIGIGAKNSVPNSPFDGRIATAAIWNRGLSAAKRTLLHRDAHAVARLREPAAWRAPFVPYPYPRGTRGGLSVLTGGLA